MVGSHMSHPTLQHPFHAPAWDAPRLLVEPGSPGASVAHPQLDPAGSIPLARRWFLLSIGSLIVAGLFALLLVVGRTPPLNSVITDPDFFKRCLVIHVNLSLLVWFCSFVAGMFCLLPGAPTPSRQRGVGFSLAFGGVVSMSATAFLPGASPILSNYIPFIHHPLFAIGLITFFAGLTVTYLHPRLWGAVDSAGTGILPPEAVAGIRFSALAALIAASTFLAAWAATPRSLPPEAYYEFVAWGGGHVLQVANVAAMLAIWLILLRRVLKRPVVSPRVAFILFGILIAPHAVAPLLTIEGTTTALYHRGSTQLMRWGIFPIVSVFLILGVWRMVEAKRAGRLGTGWWKSACFIGFSMSAVMTVTGFILGAMIRDSSTMVPAHYHASIGAVTVAFMAMAYLLIKPLGFRLRSLRLKRLIPWQLGLFGVGQLVFAVGFGVGGAFGLGRKEYASEQYVGSIGEYAGLAVMGLGGLVAVAGGILFLVLMFAAAAGRSKEDA